MPFISVVVPVYNVERYLERCVESLIKQNYNDYEIILIDDGSTDSSGSICDKLAGKYKTVTAVHKVNGGLASARNYGLNYVRGKYVTFVDSDDWVTSDYFEYIQKHLNEKKPDVLKFGYQKIQNGNLGTSVTPYFKEGYYNREKIETEILPGVIGPISLFDYSKNALLSACVCAYSVEFLRRYVLQFQSEREVLNEDHLFNFTALLRANTVEIVKKVLYFYDFREGSLTKRYIENMYERKKNLLNEYKKILLECNAFEQYKDAYYSQCVDSFYACITNECGNWKNNDRKQENRHVKNILQSKDCQYALKVCRHNNLSIKGNFIYCLMRCRQASLICLLYKLLKKNRVKE